MADAPFFVSGLQPDNIIKVDRVDSPDPLAIKVISGTVAGSGLVYILKGEIQPPDSLADPAPVVAIKVILKVIPRNMKAEERDKKEKLDRERIQRELAVVHHVRHQYILPFLGKLSTTNYTVIVSPFMDNGDLLRYIKENPAAKREPLILQVAIAVAHLHSQEGIVHGDLKCENVLVSRGGEVQLTDFGFSTPVEKPENEDTTATAIRVSTTLRFAAPELILDTAKTPSGRTKSKTPESDVYAFAMLILQAFSEARPWPHLKDQAVVREVSRGVIHPRLDNATAAGLSDPWWQLCLNCWKYKPENRMSMLAAATRIRSILGVPGEPGDDAPSKTKEIPSGGSRFKWPWSK